MELIDKDALVAEIEKQMERAKFEAQQAQENNDYVSCVGWSEHFATCGDILKIINTLEVKEVDLDKEVNNYISNNFFGSQTIGFYANRTKEEPNDQDIALCAKHFFELGIAVNNKAQKGE